MILSIILIVLIAGVAFFHYTQGLYAATCSAFAAGAAALVAFGVYEPLVLAYFAPKLGSYASGLTMVVLFAVVYVGLRLIIDNFIPGNVRYPVVLDKVGAAVMGLVAGFFVSGLLGLVAQSLPFGVAAAPFARYDTQDAIVDIPRPARSAYGMSSSRRATEDTVTFYGALVNEEVGTEAGEDSRQNLLLPLDNWFLGLAAMVGGEGGSLQGQTQYTDIYPDFQQTLFGYNVGIERGAKQFAVSEDLSVPYIFALEFGENRQYPAGIMRVDGDFREGRSRDDNGDTYTPPSGRRLLVLRTRFESSATDPGGLVRFSPGTARLVAGGEQYFPVGVLESGQFLVRQRIDDYLFTEEGVDLVYEVDAEVMAGESTLGEETFFEFKRFGRVDLGGERVYGYVTVDSASNAEIKAAARLRISQRLSDDDNRRPNMDAFDNLRSSQPEEPADPEQAEARYREGNAESVAASEARDTPPSEDDTPGEDEEEGEDDEGEGMIGELRRESDRRNRELDPDE